MMVEQSSRKLDKIKVLIKAQIRPFSQLAFNSRNGRSGSRAPSCRDDASLFVMVKKNEPLRFSSGAGKAAPKKTRDRPWARHGAFGQHLARNPPILAGKWEIEKRLPNPTCNRTCTLRKSAHGPEHAASRCAAFQRCGRLPHRVCHITDPPFHIALPKGTDHEPRRTRRSHARTRPDARTCPRT